MTKFTLENGKTIIKPFNKIWIVLGIVLTLVILSTFFITFNPDSIILSELSVIVIKLFTPQGNRTWGDYFGFMLTLKDPLVETLQLSLAGTVIGSMFSVPVAILAAKNIFKSKYIYLPFRFVMNLIRTIPVIVLAVLSVYMVGSGVFSGLIAITIFTFGIMSKMLYEVIESVDMSPYEALESTGATRTQAFRFAIFPQVFPVFISYLIYVFEINIRASAIFGYFGSKGAGGLGTVIQVNTLYNYDRVGATIIVMLALILVIQFASNWVRGKLQ